MKILVTGTAGFIGFHLVQALAKEHHEIVGIDNINGYYDTELKYARLEATGIQRSEIAPLKVVASDTLRSYRFIQMDLLDTDSLRHLFATEQFTHVCNLAGQAGVRYSIEHPESYIESNVMGFLHILEACRHHGVKNLVYASSSSVYGENSRSPFSESDSTDFPVSLYAATKKSNELMAHTYSKLYGISTIGLRFFTVYGPWGRPDMAPFKFLKNILEDKTIEVYNYGECRRDFTYVDDIVEGVKRILEWDNWGEKLYRIYNIGCSHPIHLMDFIQTLEDICGKQAHKQLLPLQKGDVPLTYADTERLGRDFGYRPSTPLKEGLQRFYQWYLHYYCQ